MNDLEISIIPLRGFLFGVFLTDFWLDPDVRDLHGECEYAAKAKGRVDLHITTELLADLFTDRESNTIRACCLRHCPIVPKQGEGSEDLLLLFFR